MKKLMIAAAAATIAGGAFAAPLVYEYKAALKNMNLKEVNVTIDKAKYVVYMKYSTSTSLKGWLIMDQDGVTSPTIMTDRLSLEPNTNADGWAYGSASTGFDYGRNRGFLVVINPKAYKGVRRPKILPAILDAKWIDTAFKKNHTATSGLAEGYLYVGGDAVKPVRPQLDLLDSWLASSTQRSITNDPPVIGAQVPYVPSVAAAAAATDDGTGTAGQTATTSSSVSTNYSGMVAIADYVWTSIYLFASSTEKEAYFNGPNWFNRNKANSPFGMFEFAWDQNLPPFLQTGWITNTLVTATKKPISYYHDTWMNGSGVAGKWSKAKVEGDWCCGIIDFDSFDAPVLDTLSGNVKGGLFLCTENGIDATDAAYNWFDYIAWEDQFNTARLDNADLFTADSWQNDLWQDGFFEIETTDVITGTWIIKRSDKFFAKKTKIAEELTADEVKLLKQYTFNNIPNTVDTQIEQQKKDADGNPLYIAEDGTETTDSNNGANPPAMETVTLTWTSTSADTQGWFAYDALLWSAIKGAAIDLAKKNGGKLILFNGKEIYAQNQRADLPMVTPQFALYYRLVYGAYDKSAAASSGGDNP